VGSLTVKSVAGELGLDWTGLQGCADLGISLPWYVDLRDASTEQGFALRCIYEILSGG
jgi:hypothetical protein